MRILKLVALLSCFSHHICLQIPGVATKSTSLIDHSIITLEEKYSDKNSFQILRECEEINILRKECPIEWTNLQSNNSLKLLDGYWRLNVTSLRLPKTQMLSDILQKKNHPNLNVNAEITDLYQYVDSSNGIYNNFMEVLVVDHNTNESLKSYIKTEGSFAVDQKKSNRLIVKFKLMSLVSSLDVNDKQLTIPRIKALTGAKTDDDFIKELNLPSQWSDVSFLSNNGRYRLMDGGGGNFYLLSKV